MVLQTLVLHHNGRFIYYQREVVSKVGESTKIMMGLHQKKSPFMRMVFKTKIASAVCGYGNLLPTAVWFNVKNLLIKGHVREKFPIFCRFQPIPLPPE